MADAAGNYYYYGGGNEWEVVSLTASTYAAAPGPVLPLDAHKKTEFSTPAAAAHSAIFMSHHFNLPAAEALCADLNAGRQHQLTPAVVDDQAVGTDDLDMPSPDREDDGDDDDGLTIYSDLHMSTVSTILELEAMSACDAEATATPLAPGRFHNTQTDAAGSDHRIRSTSAHHHVVPAAAATDGITTVLGSAPRPAAPAGVAANKVPSEAHAWWNKTFRFLRNNSKESLTFRFVFVAATVVGVAVLGRRDRLQLKLQFNVDTEKISCAVREPLGQVKLGMLVGGNPVAQG